MTACRISASHAEVKKLSKNLVLTAICSLIDLTVHHRVVVVEHLAVDHLDEGVEADGADQRLCERVVEERIGPLGGNRSGGRDSGGGGADA